MSKKYSLKLYYYSKWTIKFFRFSSPVENWTRRGGFQFYQTESLLRLIKPYIVASSKQFANVFSKSFGLSLLHSSIVNLGLINIFRSTLRGRTEISILLFRYIRCILGVICKIPWPWDNLCCHIFSKFSFDLLR